MAVIRCPHCNAPMTAEENLAGACPNCEAPLEVVPSTPVKTPAPLSSTSSSWPMWAFCGGLVVSCLVLGILLNYLTREVPPDLPKEEPIAFIPPPKPKKVVRKESPPVEEKQHEEKPDTSKPDPNEKDKPEAKKTETKAVEEPKEVKKAEPKPPEPKKVEEIKIAKKEKLPKKKPDPVPAVNPRRPINVPLVDNDFIKIDGDLADWKDIPHLMLNPIERGRATKKVLVEPKPGKAYVAYCPRGLLIGVDVVDTSGELENDGKPDKDWGFWNNDAVEVFIDTLNIRARDRGDLSVHQFFAFPFGSVDDPGSAGYESRIWRKANKTTWNIVPFADATGMQRAGKKTPTGWTLEMLIPRTALVTPGKPAQALKPGQTIGFELQVDTGTNVYYFWMNDNPLAHVSMHPHLWGEAVLAGSDAKIEIIDTELKPTKTVIPGKPLLVRVTDLDSSLDPAKKLKLNVIVSNKAGDRRVVAIRETPPGSGVFAGAIATRLKIGKGVVATILDLAADDRIVIEYVDQLRSNDDRNVTVRAEFLSGLGKR